MPPSADHGETERAGSARMEDRAPELTIIVPCLDEEDNVQITLDKIGSIVRREKLASFEILVLDDASSDATFQRSVDYAARHPDLHTKTFRRPEPRRGYGAIVRHGVANARGKYCVVVSGDGVDPVELVPEMLAKMRSADLVQCSRYHRPEDAKSIPLSYKTLQTCWRTAIRLITGQRLPDSTYAFKMFSRVDALSRGISSNGFSVGAELFFKTQLSGGRIDYVLSSQSTRRHGKSKFYFRRELFGFSYVLTRVLLHRIGVLWF